MGKFCIGNKLVNLANRNPFAKSLPLIIFSESDAAHSPIIYIPIDFGYGCN